MLKTIKSINFFSHFTRITTRGNYIAPLDGLRTFGFLLVFSAHLNHQVSAQHWKSTGSDGGSGLWHRVLETGEYALPLFFAISGFILGLPFARAAFGTGKPVSLKRFYLRRLTRLEPPLIINIIVLYGILVVYRNDSFWELFPHFGTTITYLHNLIFGENSVINPMTWSLEVEVQFYLLTPVLTLLFRIPTRALRRLTFCGIAAVSVSLDHYLPKPSLPAQLEFFMMGFLAIDLYLAPRADLETRYVRWDVMGFAFWPILVSLAIWGDHKEIGRFPIPFLVLGFMIASYKGPVFRRIFSYPLMTSFGGMCYTAYLYHFVVIAAMVRVLYLFLRPHDFYVHFAIYHLVIFPVCVLITCVLFLAFERPFMYPGWPGKVAGFFRRDQPREESPPSER